MSYSEKHLTTTRVKRKGHFYNQSKDNSGRFVKGTNSRWSKDNNLEVATKNILAKEKLKFIMVVNLSYSRHNKIVSEVQINGTVSLGGNEFSLAQNLIETTFKDDNVLKEFCDEAINEAIKSTGRSGIPWDEIKISFKSFEYENYSDDKNEITAKAFVRGKTLYNTELSVVEARVKEVLEDVL